MVFNRSGQRKIQISILLKKIFYNYCNRLRVISFIKKEIGFQNKEPTAKLTPDTAMTEEVPHVDTDGNG